MKTYLRYKKRYNIDHNDMDFVAYNVSNPFGEGLIDLTKQDFEVIELYNNLIYDTNKDYFNQPVYFSCHLPDYKYEWLIKSWWEKKTDETPVKANLLYDRTPRRIILYLSRKI